jgi:hypothetical protein
MAMRIEAARNVVTTTIGSIGHTPSKIAILRRESRITRKRIKAPMTMDAMEVGTPAARCIAMDPICRAAIPIEAKTIPAG